MSTSILSKINWSWVRNSLNQFLRYHIISLIEEIGLYFKINIS